MRFGWLAMCGVAGAVALGAVQVQAQGPKEVKVKLTDAKGGDAGTVTFKTEKKGVKVTIHLQNMAFGPHGVHVHQNAVCEAPDFKSAGGHFNPDSKHHGFQNPDGHHNGDLPDNVQVGEDHKGEASFLLTTISLDPAAPNSLMLNGGTSVVVHEHADDEKSDPAGNAGNRVACGVIKY